ncbi:MAG: HK97 family phage prohead protease [Eubacteriales bacterium]
MKKTQMRSLQFKDTQFRAEETEGVKKIRGYPIVFNSPGTPYRGSEWTEVIDPGALDDVDLSELRFLVAHQTAQVLGRAGINLRAEKDATGLFVEVELPDTSLARDTWELVQKRILDGMSFSFLADKWETDTERKQERVLHITDLIEVSIVTFPAYQASVVVPSEQRGVEDEDARRRAEAELDIYLTSF